MPSVDVAILDTNVVVAAFLNADTGSPVHRVVESALAGATPILLSEKLISEYRTVLRRPRIRKLHRLTDAEIDAVLVQLIQLAEIDEDPKDGPSSPDPGDQFLYALLDARPGAILVTGDRALLASSAFPNRIMTPAAFAQQWL